MINELFLINNDMLNILKSEFTKIKELSNINDEKNLTLMSTDVIRTDKIDENDEENSFIKTFKTDENEIDKNDQRQEYLLSSTSFSSAPLFLSTSSSLKNEHQEKRSVKNVENKSFLNIANILLEDISRARKSTRKTVYCSTLNEAFTKSKEVFYAIFSTFLIIVASKNIKLHRNNLSSKFKYYKKMIKHPLASRFLQITFIEIKTFQSKKT